MAPAEVVDVAVVGGGNAALCAALTARHHVNHVVLLERSPIALRGGNTRHTRNIRHTHARGDDFVIGAYDEEELWDDLLRVSGDDINESLARLTIRESASCPAFMEAHGVRWQPALRGTLHLPRTNRFFLGGGKALVNAYYATARSMGIDVRYDSKVVGLTFEGQRCTRLTVDAPGRRYNLAARAIVIAAGGFEANLDWLEEYWGPRARNFIVRGSPYNDGFVLRLLLDAGAQAVGNPKGFHAVAVDARAPQFDGGIVTRIDSIPFGIAVNAHGLRFADEGEDLWPRRYASWGRLIAEQPGQVAHSIFDAKVYGRFIPGVNAPLSAGSIPELATLLGLEPSTLVQTVRDFNAGAPVDGTVDFSRLDGYGTSGLLPGKSNWALPIDTPPYYGYPLRTGITFTYLGVTVDRDAKVQLTGGGALDNVFAAGEVMAGNVLTKGYLAGIGLTIGTVFGRIAGAGAARHSAA